MKENYDVIVSGAGPAGMTLAIDLGRRGVKVLLLERNLEPGPWPKMERTNSRSMERYRRLGLAEKIRAEGYLPDSSMDVFAAVDLGQSIVRLSYPTVAEQRKWIAGTNDGTTPLEPYQLVSQYALEPVLKAAAESTPGVTVRFGQEVVGFDHGSGGVRVRAKGRDGAEHVYAAGYLVGCDGGGSFIRKTLGIKLEGQGGIQRMSQVQFRSDTLYDRIPIGKGRHYYLADGTIFVVQGNRTDFSMHTTLPAGTDFEPVIRSYIPVDFDLEVLRVNEWTLHLLVAERYGEGRVFLAGDAVHLVIPTGGLGMNTAVGDVIDLSWKLAATVKGWGGPRLLDSYQIERHSVGLFNRQASGWAAQGPARWRAAVTPEVYIKGPRGEAARQALAKIANVEQRRVHEMAGAELGYHYKGSPIVADDDGPAPVWELNRYVPSTRPGAHLPHMWLADGRPVFDLLGDGYTLISLAGAIDARPLSNAFAEYGAPFEVLELDEPGIARVYEASLVLVRPDLHVVWRGNDIPLHPAALATLATGHAANAGSGGDTAEPRRALAT